MKIAKIDIKYLLLIGCIAFALRLWNVISIGDGFYANFLSDASTYRLWASKITAGSQYYESIFPMGPLYPYFLSLLLAIGFSFYSVLFLQIIMGTFTAIFIFIISGRLFGEKAGLLSGLMAAVYGPFVFYDGLLLSESLQLFLASIGLLFLIARSKTDYKPLNLLIAGMFIGLTALGRGTILLFPLFISIYWIIRFLAGKDKNGKKSVRRIVLLSAGILAGVLPATVHNIANHDFVLISSNFGINLYVGNNQEANGAYDEPRGLNLSSDFTGRQIAERESGRRLASSEVSSFWSGKSFSYFKDNPLSYIAGIINKVWLYLWNFDIPQAESVQIQHEFSAPFGVLPTGYWFVLLPGLMGIFFSKKDHRARLLIILFISSLSGSSLFFVIGRFKLLGTIPLLIFAGSGILRFIEIVKSKNKVDIISAGILVLCGIAILLGPRRIDRESKIASAYDNVGIACFYQNRLDEAIGWYRKAVEIKQSHSGALNNIGGYFYARHMPDSALAYFRRAVEHDPLDDKPYMNMGRTFLTAGMIDSAYFYYGKAKELSPYGVDAENAIRELDIITGDKDGNQNYAGNGSFEVYFKMAEKYAAERNYDLAERYYRKALEIDSLEIRALNNLGFICQVRGDFDSARDLFAKVIELNGANAIAYNNLASVYYRMGMLDTAVVLWEQALKYDPGNEQVKKNINFVRKGGQN